MKFITAQHNNYYITPSSYIIKAHISLWLATIYVLYCPFKKPGINYVQYVCMYVCKYKLSLQWIIKRQGLCRQNIIMEHCL